MTESEYPQDELGSDADEELTAAGLQLLAGVEERLEVDPGDEDALQVWRLSVELDHVGHEAVDGRFANVDSLVIAEACPAGEEAAPLVVDPQAAENAVLLEVVDERTAIVPDDGHDDRRNLFLIVLVELDVVVCAR